MKAIVKSVKLGPYKGPFDMIDKSLKLETEYGESLNWHVRTSHDETSLNADVGHIIEGLELTENRDGRRVVDYKKSDPRVVNRQFVLIGDK